MYSTREQQIKLIKKIKAEKEREREISTNLGIYVRARQKHDQCQMLNDIECTLGAIDIIGDKPIQALPKIMDLSIKICNAWNKESYVVAGNAVRELKDLLKTLK